MKPLTLAHDYPCTDTIEALETLLESARKGRIKGLAFVTFERNRRFSLGLTGLANEDPAQALGPMFLHMLDLSKKIHENGAG